MLQQCSASDCRCNYLSRDDGRPRSGGVRRRRLERLAGGAQAVGQHSPIAVAGVSTPPPSGRRSSSSARHSALSPSMHRGRGVAGVALRGDPRARSGGPRSCARGSSILKKPFARVFSLGPSPGAGRTRSSSLRGRAGTLSPATSAAEAGGDRARLHRAPAGRRRRHHLAVAEPAPVGVALQRVAAAHDARVDRGHHERRQPAELGVALDATQVALACRGRARRRGRG